MLAIALALVADVNFVANLITADGQISNMICRGYIHTARIFLGLNGIMLLMFLIGKVFFRFAATIVLVLGVALAVEGASVFIYKAAFGTWHFAYPLNYREIFESHPRLVTVPKPNVAIEGYGKQIRHNRFGFRGDQKTLVSRPGVRRIGAVGDSTTYGVKVSNGETWPEYLDRELGDEFIVFNLGVPGYSTAELIVQAAYFLPEFALDLVIVFAGTNDATNMHVAGLAPDYSNYYYGKLYQSIALPTEIIKGTESIATIRVLTGLLQKAGLVHQFPGQNMIIESVRSGLIDERALEIFRRNLRSLIALIQAHGARPLLVPQVLNYERLQGPNGYGWFPFVADGEIKDVMAAYNGVLREVSNDPNVYYAEGILNEEWSDADFADLTHFNPAGNLKFARILARWIQANVPVKYP